jgi:hypothetical protein
MTTMVMRAAKPYLQNTCFFIKTAEKQLLTRQLTCCVTGKKFVLVRKMARLRTTACRKGRMFWLLHEGYAVNSSSVFNLGP